VSLTITSALGGKIENSNFLPGSWGSLQNFPRRYELEVLPITQVKNFHPRTDFLVGKMI